MSMKFMKNTQKPTVSASGATNFDVVVERVLDLAVDELDARAR